MRIRTYMVIYLLGNGRPSSATPVKITPLDNDNDNPIIKEAIVLLEDKRDILKRQLH